ncbi:MAG TPA: CdaR family protein [Candidatus Dormibacteraeota bacterium]|nr:CdaR family protein [Candidatus Dormibacteraeota bacterium]
MNWITDSWRLKLLAIGLSVLMLGAVAFAQNPPTFKTLTVTSIQYTIPNNLIVINAPTRATVRVTGLADAIQSVTANSLTASFDLSKVSPGPAVKVNLTVTAVGTGVTVQNPSIPFLLDVDRRATVPLTVQVRPPRAVSGWTVTVAQARCPGNPCVVNFEGPVSWETDSKGQPNLKAYVDVGSPVSGEAFDVGNLPVTLEQGGTPVDVGSFARTVPQSGLDQPSVGVHVQAKTATTSKQVVLVAAQPPHLPPAGYSLTGITFDPVLVLVSGRADILAKVTFLTLPAADLSGHTSTFTVSVAIPYPAGVTGPQIPVRVTYSISPNPAAQPTPSPTPSP